MEIDCIKNSTPDLSANACQTKDVLTEVEHQHESTVLAKTPDQGVSLKCLTKVSSTPRLIKNFDLVPFSYICRMICEEPYTNMTEMGKSETVAPSGDLLEPQ